MTRLRCSRWGETPHAPRRGRWLFFVLALAALASLGGHARAEEVGQSVRSVLEDPRYRFCHEDDYPLTPEEHAWCPMVGEISGACPALPKACKLPPVPLAFRLRGLHTGQGDSPAERAPQEDGRQRPPDWNVSLPDMSLFARVLFFALLAVGLVFVVRAIVKNLVRNRAPDEGKDEAPSPDAPGEAEPAARSAVETDVDRLIARARAAAARGDYARAIDDAYAALLRRLDGDGLIEIHPSRTNGDYVRRLGASADLKGAVRSIARDVEGVQFGTTPPSESTFRSVLERVLPLVGRALALALVFFGLSVALSCTPHDRGDDGNADTSPSGTQAIIDVLTKHGLKVHRRAESLSKLESPLALVVLPDATLDDEAWKHLLDWVREKGGHLVVAGVTSLPDELGLRIDTDASEKTQLTVAPGNRWVGVPVLALPHGRRIMDAEESGEAGASPEVDEPLDGAVLLRGDSVVAVERTLGEGRVLVLSDARLFTNLALVVDDDASFLLRALSRAAIPPEREVEIADEWTGAGAESPLASVDHAHLTPVIVQLFLLLALLFLWKGRAFARLREPQGLARRAFVDHARALGQTYARARASRHVAGLYAVWALDRLRERVHRHGRQGLIPLAEAIAARTGRPEGEVMSVLVEASGARDEAAPPSSFRPHGPARAAAPGKDAAAADFALMNALMSFLTATGQRPNGRTNPRAR